MTDHRRLFALIRTRGPAWDDLRSLEQQDEWDAHASFMNALVREGFVALGGPLDGTSDVLLVVRARSADEIVDRLSADPWSASGLLQVRKVTPWTLRLGALP